MDLIRMPVLFVGHGSPMNAIENNNYTKAWQSISESIPKPKVILSISAHWYTNGTRIMNEEKPKTIYDMYGFPKELYNVTYNAYGAPNIAKQAKDLFSKEAKFDNSWGLDHGTWSVLVHMYPKRDIPVFQISIDANSSPETHYQLGVELKSLRDQGVLIFGSGNIVHNLSLVDWTKLGKGYDWAINFDDFIYENIQNKNYAKVLKFNDEGITARLAVPTPDHFYPLLYILGASDEDDKIKAFNRSCELGSLSMTSYLIGDTI